MKSVSPQILNQTVSILGDSNLDEDAVDSRVAALVTDELMVRRLVDFVPKAFGIVLASPDGN